MFGVCCILSTVTVSAQMPGKYSDRENDLLIGNVKEIVERHIIIAKTNLSGQIPLSSNYEYVLGKEYDSAGRYIRKLQQDGILQDFPDCWKRYLIEGRLMNRMDILGQGQFSITDKYKNVWDVPFSGYGGTGREQRFLYTLGKVTEIEDYTFEYDHNGNLIKRYYKGRPTRLFQWIENKLVKISSYTLEGNLAYGSDNVDCILKWSGNDVTTEHAGHQAIYSYNSEGKIKSIKNFAGNVKMRDFNPNVYSIIIYNYNSQGLINKEIFKGNDGKVLMETNYTYDDKMNLLKCIIKYSNQNPDRIFEWDYAYDNIGNWISRECYEIKQGDIEIRNKIYIQTRTIVYFN